MAASVALAFLAASPAGAVPVVVTNVNDGVISTFATGAGGALTPLCDPATTCPSVGTSASPEPVAFSPDGSHVYVGNIDSNSISVFSVGAGGALTPVACDPATSCHTGTSPEGVVVDPSGTHVYATNFDSDTISVFSIGVDGALTQDCDPATNCPAAGDGANGLAIDSTGQHLYVADFNANRMAIFSIGADGALTPECDPATNCPQTGVWPSEPVIAPAAPYLYVPNQKSNTVSVFSIRTDGTLTQACDPATDCPKTGMQPYGVAIDPSGTHLYVPNFTSKNVSEFSIGASGALTQVCDPASSCPATPSDAYAAAVDPAGADLYVPDYTAKTVSIFSIGSGGALTSVACTPAANCQTGDRPSNFSIAVGPDRGPAAAFSASAAPAGSPSTFDGTGSSSPDYPIATYKWSWGDGTTQTTAGAAIQHVYSTPGTYTVTLAVSDEAGCSQRFVSDGRSVFCDGSAKAQVTRTIVIPSVVPSAGGSQLPGPSSLTELSVSPGKFSLAGRKAGGRCVKPTAKNRRNQPCRRPISLRVSYKLTGPSTVTFQLKRLVPGRSVNGRCVNPTTKNRQRRKCTRVINVHGTLTRTGTAGTNQFTFKGRFGGTRLGPGTYQLIATPSGGTSRSTKFTLTP